MVMIEAEKEQLTPEYMDKIALQSLTHGLVMYLGEELPNYINVNEDEWFDY
jgi:hypothetical protein